MAQVVLKELNKKYDEVHAVKDVNLTIRDKEFMVLVGPSGCGKTTTLRMVAGLEEITAGEIVIGDRVVNDLPPKDRDIAMVFQNYALYPHMTVYDNMAFGLKMRKYPKPEIDRRVREAAAVLGLSEFLARKPKALSGGQRQRVAVGRAIVRKPKVFLFDEPLSNLDARLRVQMRTEISRLHQELGATMLYVTHDQVEAMTMGTRITIMRDGDIQQIDGPLTLYREPKNRFVAEFIGSPAMNLFDGSLRSESSGAVFDAGTFSVALGRRQDVAAFPRRLALGVRPENLALAEAGGDGVLDAVIELVEPLGSEIYLHGRTGDERVVARVGPDHPVRVGDRVRFAMDLERIHFFDGESGVALRPAPSQVA
ncbi:MAG: ABC transporter ATP-binding protein [bacterium]